MQLVRKYLSLIKFSHTIFAMPFALIGFFLALRDIWDWAYSVVPGWHVTIYPESSNIPVTEKEMLIRLVLVVLCMVFARSAAMAFNRWLDAKFDALNPRTAIREIPAGVIAPKNALLFVILSCIAFVVCTWFINFLCFVLSPVALFVILFYSYTKRFTALCHLVLGIGLALAPIGAYLAVTGFFSLLPVLFSLVVLFWVSGFDIIYALQDEAFDREHQLHSIPAALGKSRALFVSQLLHLLATICLVIAGLHGEFGLFYWLGTAAFAGMLLYQHSIISPEDLRRVNVAFMTANGIASIIFALFVILDILIRSGFFV